MSRYTAITPTNNTGTEPMSTTTIARLPPTRLSARTSASAATEVQTGMLDDGLYQDLSTVAMLEQLLVVGLSANRLPFR